MAFRSSLPEERLRALYEGAGFGGDTTMRAKVIRELINEVRALRDELAQKEATSAATGCRRQLATDHAAVDAPPDT